MGRQPRAENSDSLTCVKKLSKHCVYIIMRHTFELMSDNARYLDDRSISDLN